MVPVMLGNELCVIIQQDVRRTEDTRTVEYSNVPAQGQLMNGLDTNAVTQAKQRNLNTNNICLNTLAELLMKIVAANNNYNDKSNNNNNCNTDIEMQPSTPAPVTASVSQQLECTGSTEKTNTKSTCSSGNTTDDDECSDECLSKSCSKKTVDTSTNTDIEELKSENCEKLKTKTVKWAGF